MQKGRGLPAQVVKGGLGGEPIDRFRVPSPARPDDADVHLPEPLDRCLDQSPTAVGFGDVGGDRVRGSAVGAAASGSVGGTARPNY
jgi:hypothetical protein